MSCIICLSETKNIENKSKAFQECDCKIYFCSECWMKYTTEYPNPSCPYCRSKLKLKWDFSLVMPVGSAVFCIITILFYALYIDEIKYDDPYYALIRYICVAWVLVVMSGLEYLNMLDELNPPHYGKIILRSILLTFDIVYVIILHIVLIKNIIGYTMILANTIGVCVFLDLVCVYLIVKHAPCL